MQILNTSQIKQKIDRIAYQIYEQNYAEKQIIFAGLNNSGKAFATMLKTKLDEISSIESIICNINLNPANPAEDDITMSITPAEVKDKVVIVVDDVANTGRTIFYSFDPLLKSLPKKIEVAVLVDRQHKNYPIKVDYIGLSLATTLQENIRVELSGKNKMEAHLE